MHVTIPKSDRISAEQKLENLEKLENGNGLLHPQIITSQFIQFISSKTVKDLMNHFLHIFTGIKI